MPAYFQFLTLMAFHVFLDEQVDVAIIEVGIGGEHDSTNIVKQLFPFVIELTFTHTIKCNSRNTKTVGISALGFDHTELLGDTLAKIAWQKAGIMKHNCNAYTCIQPSECNDVLKTRSAEKNVHTENTLKTSSDQ